MFIEMQIWMTSEGSRDNEDWINDAENSAHDFKIYLNWKKLF